ncbi:MAG: orotate phosphoribosyltransferase [Pseudomonadota bacterium]
MTSSILVDKAEIARLTARMLLEINAVHFRADEPYIFTSGLASPVYIDCRKLISFPRIRATLMDFAVATFHNKVGLEQIDAVAGGETAGIPFAAWIAERMALPMLYVRKKPKGFGRDARIEGALTEGQRVLLVEDLTTDGGSKVSFCNALREAGAEVSDTLVVFYYDIFKDAPDELAEHGIRLHYLATWWDVLAEAREQKRFDAQTLAEVEKFLHEPAKWSANHGGKST